MIALAGGFMAFKNIKWSFAAGALNFLIGIAHMLGWIGATGGGYSASYGGGSASVKVNPQIGLILFVIASALFVIATLKYLKAPKAE